MPRYEFSGLHGEVVKGVSSHFAYMPQSDLLLPWKTILDNVTLYGVLHGQKKEAEKRAKAAAKEEAARIKAEEKAEAARLKAIQKEEEAKRKAEEISIKA